MTSEPLLYYLWWCAGMELGDILLSPNMFKFIIFIINVEGITG